MLDQLAIPRTDLSAIDEGVDPASHEQIARVWQANAALGRAVTIAQAAAFVVEGGLVASGASGGALAIMTENRHALQLVHRTGVQGDLAQRRLPILLTAPLPLADAVRSRRELWIATP